MANIEFVQGNESHSSNWGKYYVKGLESFQCKEDGSYDKHSSYTEYQCNDIPEGVVFTIFEQSGNKRGTEVFNFRICVADDSQVFTNAANYGDGNCAGNYRVVAEGVGATKAPRLMSWWTDQFPKNADRLAFAQHCAEYIDKRGIKDVPAMAILITQEERDRLLLADELEKLVIRFGAAAVKTHVEALS
jgi:hypothetical protein